MNPKVRVVHFCNPECYFCILIRNGSRVEIDQALKVSKKYRVLVAASKRKKIARQKWIEV